MAIEIISSSEFRKNQRYYMDIARKRGVVYISQKNEGVFTLRPASEIEFYYSNPKVRAGIKESLEEVKRGDVFEMHNGETLEEFLDRTK
ncbi:MAG: hypothetical protein ACTTIA_07190 [Candidatus Cryptobacteroides sp.]